MPVKHLGLALPLGLLCGAAGAAWATSSPSDWSPGGLVVLLFLVGVLGDRFEIESTTSARVVGSLPTFVLAAVLCGPAPAAAVGVATTLVEQTRRRRPFDRAL